LLAVGWFTVNRGECENIALRIWRPPIDPDCATGTALTLPTIHPTTSKLYSFPSPSAQYPGTVCRIAFLSLFFPPSCSAAISGLVFLASSSSGMTARGKNVARDNHAKTRNRAGFVQVCRIALKARIA
jgi:hypothetical protein